MSGELPNLTSHSELAGQQYGLAQILSGTWNVNNLDEDGSCPR